MDSERFEELLASEAEEVRILQEFMQRSLKTDIELIYEVSRHIFAGGKRLRALIALLSMRNAGVEKNVRFQVAAAIEFIHCATLLHDDVVDNSEMRRHRETANKVFGNPASVLVGDFLYSRASQICAATGNASLVNHFADATNLLAEGEVIQLVNLKSLSHGEQRYFEVIGRKTASLFQLAAISGPVLAGSGAEGMFGSYGWNLGISFQIIDDALDYDGSPEATGKKIGKDLEERKVTLPLIYGLETLPADRRNSLLLALQEGRIDDDQRKELFEISSMSATIQRVRSKAEEHAMIARRSLFELEETLDRDVLIGLAGASVYRVR